MNWAMIRDTIQVLRNSQKLNALRHGVNVKLTNGENVHVQVKSKRLIFQPEFQFSKYSFVSSAFVNGEAMAEGHGSSNIMVIALAKSVSESFERALFRVLKSKGFGKQTTNGWAAHFTEDQAYSAARSELLER